MANQAGFDVDLIGWDGSAPMDSVINNPNITLHVLQQQETIFHQFFFTRVLYKVILVFFQLLSLLLFKIQKPDYILVQTPPAIPVLLIASLVCWIRKAKLVIDWHNLGYTWLAVNRPGSTFLVPLHKLYEKIFGKMGHYHFCVSKAMKNELFESWKLDAQVVYDQAPEFFRESTNDEKKALFEKYKEWGVMQSNEKQDAVIVSSTSWTADEDFDILLEAIKLTDIRISNSEKTYPRTTVIITGKGDLREHYENLIPNLKLQNFRIVTGFLPHADYVKLLGSADIGVSLHTSSSKVDLPMKVVDMLGARLPVVAYDYGCLDELVQDYVNGVTFKNSEDLSEAFLKLLENYPKNELLNKIKNNIRNQEKITWEDNWNQFALPIFKGESKKEK